MIEENLTYASVGPLMPPDEIAVRFRGESTGVVSLKDALKPYSDFSGVDLLKLREKDYEGLASSEVPTAEDLEGYFDPGKQGRKYFVYFVKDFYQQEERPAVKKLLQSYALKDPSEHGRLRDMVIVEEEVIPGITAMMIFDYPLDPWKTAIPLPEGREEEVPYLRLRDILYINNGEQTAFSQYSSGQHEEEGDAKGCLDRGLLRPNDFARADFTKKLGRSLACKEGFSLWTDGEITTEESAEVELPFPGLADVVASLRESGDSQARLAAFILEQLGIICAAARRKGFLPKFLAKFLPEARKLNVSDETLFDDMVQGIETLIKEGNAV